MPLEGNVALVARRRDQLDALADSIAADGGRALLLEADVTGEACHRRIAVNELLVRAAEQSW